MTNSRPKIGKVKICAINDKDSIDIAQNHCAVCGKNFADKRAFLFTHHLITDAKAMQKLFGKWVLVDAGGYKLIGRVAEPDSPCAEEGKNLGFAVCSKKCGEILQSITENIQDFKSEQVKEKKREIFVCPHLEKLANDERSGIISQEQSEEMKKQLGLHGIEGPDRVVVLVCSVCYKIGDFVYREDKNGKRYHLRWPIELDEFKGKGES
jgi:hypothetical protein